MIKIILSLILFTLAQARDEVIDSKNLCDLKETNTSSKMNFNFVPSWFAKSVPGGASAGIIISGNPYLLDLKSGQFHLLEGNYDPVPTPDGLFVTSIGKTMYWTLTKNALSTEGNALAVRWADDNYDSAWKYQSIGILKNQSPNALKSYRVLVDNDKGALYARTVSFIAADAEKSLANSHISDGAWLKICPNVKATLKLPMISKDGQMVSVYNTASDKTEIYNLSDDGSCSLKTQLPFGVAKTDFSYDNKQVTFHRTAAGDNSEWFEHATLNDRINIYTYDLNTKKIKRITDHVDGNSYFPTFLPDGKIGFLSQTPSGEGKGYAYEIVDPNGAKLVSLVPDDSCIKQYSAAVAIGKMWAALCPDLAKSLTIDSTAMTSFSIPASNCRKIVDKNWADYKENMPTELERDSTYSAFKKSDILSALQEVSIKDLEAACGDEPKAPARQKGERVQTADVAKVKKLISPSSFFKATCSACHDSAKSAGGVAFDFANPSKINKSLRTEIVARIKNGSMPPGGKLDPSEISTLVKFIIGNDEL